MIAALEGRQLKRAEGNRATAEEAAARLPSTSLESDTAERSAAAVEETAARSTFSSLSYSAGSPQVSPRTAHHLSLAPDWLNDNESETKTACVSAPKGSSETRKVYHIIENKVGMAWMHEIELPPDAYYDLLGLHLQRKFPQADTFVIAHLVELEALPDVCIVSGFSVGIDKAKILATEGELLGDIVGRAGIRASGQRAQGIIEFAPIACLKEMQQFLGFVNWVRKNMIPLYSTIIKILSPTLRKDYDYPKEGFPAEGPIRALKILAKHLIELGVMDEAAAMDGSRPLEQVGDSSGIAWGGFTFQMRPDLDGFVPLLAAGKSLTPSQQAWDALTLEGYACLMMKREQNTQLGHMACICWTDHANWTRRGGLIGIEIKHLRWYSEIVQYGSVVRSLSGRNAKLADGISRNPANRDAVIARRTRDLEGYAGQIRGFNLEEFLDDKAEPGAPFAWAPGDHVLPDEIDTDILPPEEEEREGMLSIYASAKATGLTTGRAVVLHLPDYVSTAVRIAQGTEVIRAMERFLPGFVIEPSGPFDDDMGIAAFFDKPTKKSPEQIALDIKRDLYTSMATVLRAIAANRPDITAGEGQGATVALCLCSPLMVEVACGTRNLKMEELPMIGPAWSGVKQIVARNPRVARRDKLHDRLKAIAPELFVRK
jgi:hypothetical protein